MTLLRLGFTLLVAWAGVWLFLAGLERLSLYHPPREYLPVRGVDYEAVTLTALDGVRLSAWYLPAPGATAGLLFMGGNASNISHYVYDPGFRQFFTGLGVNLLLLDYRGYGASEGRPSERGLYLDARAAYDFLAARGPVVVYGWSLGGAVAARLAAEAPVAGLILQAPLSGVAEAGRDVLGPLALLVHLMPGLPMHRYDAVAAIRRVQAPLLVLHGDRDAVLPIRHGRLVYGAHPGPKEFVVLSGYGHNDVWSGRAPPADLAAAVRRFLASIQTGG